MSASFLNRLLQISHKEWRRCDGVREYTGSASYMCECQRKNPRRGGCTINVTFDCDMLPLGPSAHVRSIYVWCDFAFLKEYIDLIAF